MFRAALVGLDWTYDALSHGPIAISERAIYLGRCAVGGEQDIEQAPQLRQLEAEGQGSLLDAISGIPRREPVEAIASVHAPQSAADADASVSPNVCKS